MKDSNVIPFAFQAGIQIFLPEKFVQPVVSIVVTHQQNLFDVVRYRWHPSFRGRISLYRNLSCIGTVVKHRRVLVEAFHSQAV